jgi:hypothetical protein
LYPAVVTPVFGEVRVAAVFTPVFGEVRVAAVFTPVFGEVHHITFSVFCLLCFLLLLFLFVFVVCVQMLPVSGLSILDCTFGFL